MSSLQIPKHPRTPLVTKLDAPDAAEETEQIRHTSILRALRYYWAPDGLLRLAGVKGMCVWLGRCGKSCPSHFPVETRYEGRARV